MARTFTLCFSVNNALIRYTNRLNQIKEENGNLDISIQPLKSIPIERQPEERIYRYDKMTNMNNLANINKLTVPPPYIPEERIYRYDKMTNMNNLANLNGLTVPPPYILKNTY